MRQTVRFMAPVEGAPNAAEDPMIRLLCENVVSQRLANFHYKGEPLVDARRFSCPSCGAAGFNSGWGYCVFTCGAEVTNGEDGEFTAECPHEGESHEAA